MGTGVVNTTGDTTVVDMLWQEIYDSGDVGALNRPEAFAPILAELFGLR